VTASAYPSAAASAAIAATASPPGELQTIAGTAGAATPPEAKASARPARKPARSIGVAMLLGAFTAASLQLALRVKRSRSASSARQGRVSYSHARY
jgi:hypothetical protein